MPDAERQGRSFNPPTVNADYDYSAILWRRIANVNETMEIEVLFVL